MLEGKAITRTAYRGNGLMPVIGEEEWDEIALYEYGNDNLPMREGYIRQVTPFTSDLDLISEKLFKLKTLGGSEFCGEVISVSLRQLEWGDAKKDGGGGRGRGKSRRVCQCRYGGVSGRPE